MKRLGHQVDQLFPDAVLEQLRRVQSDDAHQRGFHRQNAVRQHRDGVCQPRHLTGGGGRRAVLDGNGVSLDGTGTGDIRRRREYHMTGAGRQLAGTGRTIRGERDASYDRNGTPHMTGTGQLAGTGRHMTSGYFRFPARCLYYIT